MSDNAYYTVLTLAVLAGFSALVAGFTAYNAHKVTRMSEMVQAGADPIKVRAMMEGGRVLYVEVPAK